MSSHVEALSDMDVESKPGADYDEKKIVFKTLEGFKFPLESEAFMTSSVESLFKIKPSCQEAKDLIEEILGNGLI